MKIGVIVVVYNRWCGDCQTCKAFQNNTVSPDEILIMDNSTKDFGNGEYCADLGWLYCSMNGNQGLTKAYNRGLELLKDRVDLVVWADDDTLFPEDYIRNLQDYAEKDSADVFLPMVKSGNYFLSPAIFREEKVFPIASLRDLEGEEITAINSGMAVRTSLYGHYRYDERIFLDFVDHDFMRWCRSQGVQFCLMEGILIQQSFFGDSLPSARSRRIRARIYSKDYRVFYSKSGRGSLRISLEILWYWLQIEYQCLKTRIKRFKVGG